MKNQNKIKNFEMQVKYQIQPEFIDFEGQKVSEIAYILDFKITLLTDEEICIDVKGDKNSTEEVARVKMKMWMYQNNDLPIYFIGKLPKYLGNEWVEVTKSKDFASKLKNKYINIHGKWKRNTTPNWNVETWKEYFEFENYHDLFYRWKKTRAVKKKKNEVFI